MRTAALPRLCSTRSDGASYSLRKRVICVNQVRYIGREICIREVAFAVSESRKIESQHSNSELREPARQLRCGIYVLRAGEAVSEDRKRFRFANGEFETTGQRPLRFVKSNFGMTLLHSELLRGAPNVSPAR